MSTQTLCPVLKGSMACLIDLKNQNNISEDCLEHLFIHNQTLILEEILCSTAEFPDCYKTILKENGPALLDHCQIELIEEDSTNASSTIVYTCHEPRAEYQPWIAKAQFWMEHVGIIVVGIFGTAGNIMTVLVLRRINSNVTFNKLLMSLGK